MLPLIYQWSVVVVYGLWPIVAGGQNPTNTPCRGQDPTNTTYEVPPPEFVVPTPLGHPKFVVPSPLGHPIQQPQSWLNQKLPPGWTTIEEFVALVGVGPLVDEIAEEVLELPNCYDYSGPVGLALGLPDPSRDFCPATFDWFLKKYEKPLVNLVQMSPTDPVKSLQKQFEGFLGMSGKKLLEDRSLDEVRLSEFEFHNSLQHTGPLDFRRQAPSFLAEYEKPLVDLNPRLPTTNLKFSHTFLEYATHTSVKLIWEDEPHLNMNLIGFDF